MSYSLMTHAKFQIIAGIDGKNALTAHKDYYFNWNVIYFRREAPFHRLFCPFVRLYVLYAIHFAKRQYRFSADLFLLMQLLSRLRCPSVSVRSLRTIIFSRFSWPQLKQRLSKAFSESRKWVHVQGVQEQMCFSESSATHPSPTYRCKRSSKFSQSNVIVRNVDGGHLSDILVISYKRI